MQPLLNVHQCARDSGEKESHTFEFFHAESNRWHYVMILFVVGLEMIEDGRLARVVKTDHEDAAFLFLKAQKVDQLVEKAHC